MIKAAWGHRLALVGSLGLLALWLYWVTVPATFPSAARAPILTLSTLPVLFNLRGLVHERRRSYLWLGLVSLGYFIHGVTEAVTGHDRAIAGIEIALALTLFAGTLVRLRLP